MDSFGCVVKNFSLNNLIESKNAGDKHNERSKAWIDQIACRLINQYGKECVFWRNYDNK